MHTCRLFGTRSSEMRSDWIVIHVNFTAIFLRTCEASDYYPWTVSDGVSPCVYVVDTATCDQVVLL